MSRFLSERLRRIEEYTPGEQPQDKKYIKLNTNESPYPPSDGVIKALGEQQIKDLRLYSDPECKRLRAEMAALYGVCEENVFLSNGSDETLNFAFMAYGQRGAAFADITYGFYRVFAELYGIETTVIPLKDDFTLDVDAFCGQNKLVVIANPNAPTGLDIPLSSIERIVESNPEDVVLIDEAYVDFGGSSCVELTKKYKNLLCVGTFSKSRSLAGARLGFGIASSELIADLEKIKYSTNPYNVNRLTQIAGEHAILDNGYYMDNCERIKEDRAFTKAALEDMGFTVLDSKANFLFAKSDRIGGTELYTRLKEKGVLVRHFTGERIRDFNRITIGNRAEMEIFISKVKEIVGDNI